jgi:uncharacterized Zn-binding protein involved in type VI secretion
MAIKDIACLGDPSTHGGTINLSGQSGFKKAGGVPIAVAGATHSCPIPGHGVTPITPITIKTFIEGKLIITAGATAGCGATITPIPRW